jgi:hypothetical protein
MSWTVNLRLGWQQLFYSRYTQHLEEEICYLRNEIATVRIDKDRLQLMLNEVNPAGEAMRRRENPPKRPEQNAVPGPKRWAQLQDERFAEIAANRRKAAEEKATQVAAT